MLSAFVTVGTTEFDELIETAMSPAVLAALASRGVGQMQLQIGRGRATVDSDHISPIRIDSYGIKSSISDDIRAADIVIGHAGAGTCLEVLSAHKPLIVVINASLQDNHQLELAQQLAADGHVLYCYPDQLATTIGDERLFALTPWNAGDPKLFRNWLNDYMGVSSVTK